ncbi:MAG: Hsp20/alpha crystallin family protein [Petrotogales bacterium]
MARKKEKKINVKKDKKRTQEKSTTPALWNPFELMDAMDRWFWEDPWAPFWHRRRRGSLIPRKPWFTQRWEPDMKFTAVDLVDTGKEYKVIAEMPGVLKKDVEVSITPNDIRICGEMKTETKKEEEGYIRRERGYSTLCRTMPFPEEVNPDKAEAALKDGILEIKIGKKRPTTGRGRNIPVK